MTEKTYQVGITIFNYEDGWRTEHKTFSANENNFEERLYNAIERHYGYNTRFSVCEVTPVKMKGKVWQWKENYLRKHDKPVHHNAYPRFKGERVSLKKIESDIFRQTNGVQIGDFIFGKKIVFVAKIAISVAVEEITNIDNGETYRDYPFAKELNGFDPNSFWHQLYQEDFSGGNKFYLCIHDKSFLKEIKK